MIQSKIKKQLFRLFSNNIMLRLGYPLDAKLLIIHADDFGLSEVENAATINAIEMGMVNSASVMVPCRGFSEVVQYAKRKQNIDLGIHLTLTSEWPNYKWKPIMPSDSVKSLVDDHGYFFSRKEDVVKRFEIEDVIKEFRAQIDIALKAGIDLTHIDSHMFIAFSDPKIQRAYLDLGREYKLPTLVSHNKLNIFFYKKDSIVVDEIFIAEPADYYQGLSDYYKSALKSLNPGLNIILIHLSLNTSEMLYLTNGAINYGNDWRNTDYMFFTDPACKKLIEENNIQLITWREIRDKLIINSHKNSINIPKGK